MKKKFRKILSLVLNDYWFTFFMFIVKLRYIPNFKKPRTLNEKFNYIKLFKTNYNLRCMISDRLKVREFVNENSAECNLINNLWVGDEFNLDVWNHQFPQKFVIKANHGSGMVKIVDKEDDNFEDVERLCKKWLETDYYSLGKEWFYKDLNRFLIVEEFLEFSGNVPPDFKFFCMNGKVRLVQVDLDRFSGHARNIYDENFKRIDGELLYPQGYEIDKPKMYHYAVKIAEELSQKFDFIRVDLYLFDDKVYFGELTNIPENGLGCFRPKNLDIELGSKLVLSNEKN